jgi:hypothetical protein
MPPTGVVLDACVLIKASLRDTLLRAYGAGLYRLCWTDDIFAEVEANLIEHRLAAPDRAARLMRVLREVLADAYVTGHTLLIPDMPNEPKDRHVLAAAVTAGARQIVTDNLRHFPATALAAYGIEALSPDDFLCALFDAHADTLVEIIVTQAAVLTRPQLTTEQVLDNLARDGAAAFAGRVRTRLHQTRS